MKLLKKIIKMIDLQEEVAALVISNFKSLNFEKYKEDIKQLSNIKNAPDARNRLIEALEPDSDNMRILTCMLYGLTYTYHSYQKLGINDEIFSSTMKCFTRFLQEHWNGYQEWVFDRDWWVYRQIAMTIFRLGELEYEMKDNENGKYISIHIPSDANFSMDQVKTSISYSLWFFEKYFPDYTDVEYRCHSWLLSPHLKTLLPENSNILRFQSLFTLVKEDYSSSGYIEWVYKRKYQDYNELPETTTLQRNMKRYLLDGKVVSIGTGVLKISD